MSMKNEEFPNWQNQPDPAAEYGRSKSMDKRLAAQGAPQPTEPPATPSESDFNPMDVKVEKEIREIFERIPAPNGVRFSKYESDIVLALMPIIARRAAASQAALTGADEIVEACAAGAQCSWSDVSERGTCEYAAKAIRALKGKFSLPPAALIEKLEGLRRFLTCLDELLCNEDLTDELLREASEGLLPNLADAIRVALRSPATKAEDQ